MECLIIVAVIIRLYLVGFKILYVFHAEFDFKLQTSNPEHGVQQLESRALESLALVHFGNIWVHWLILDGSLVYWRGVALWSVHFPCAENVATFH